MSAKDVLAKLDWYQEQLEAVRRDGNLSQAGRERQLANLRASYHLYHDTAYNTLKAEWSSIKSKFAMLSKQKQAAAQAESDTWDYSKLAYYKEHAQNAIRQADTIRDVEKLIRAAVDGGSREQARAYTESTSVVSSRFAGRDGLGSLLGEMGRIVSQLTRAPGVDKLEAKEQELKREAVELRKDTITAAGYYPMLDTPMLRLLDGVSIRARVDSTSGEFEWDVNFIEAEPVSGEAVADTVAVA